VNLFHAIELFAILMLLVFTPGLIGAYGWGVGCSVAVLGIGAVVLFDFVRWSVFRYILLRFPPAESPLPPSPADPE